MLAWSRSSFTLDGADELSLSEDSSGGLYASLVDGVAVGSAAVELDPSVLVTTDDSVSPTGFPFKVHH